MKVEVDDDSIRGLKLNEIHADTVDNGKQEADAEGKEYEADPSG